MESNFDASLPRILGLANRLDLPLDSQEKVRSHVIAKIGIKQFDSVEKIELRIRVLVERHAEWSELAPVVRHWLALNPNLTNCARSIELAALYGDHEAIIECFLVAEPHGAEIFSELHHKVRTQIAALHFQKRLGNVLSQLLYPVRNEAWLLPIERLLIFYHMQAEKELSFLYMRTYKDQIAESIDHYHSVIGVSPGTIFFSAARNALILGGKKEATELLKKVTASDPYYQVSIKLLLSLEEDEKNVLATTWAKDLFEKPDWKFRLSILEDYLRQCRLAKSHYHDLFPILNTLFLRPDLFCQDQSDAISRFAKLLLSYTDLKSVIPNIDYLFRSNIKTYHSPAKDGAIWQAILNSESDQGIEQKWKAIALLHRFVGGGSKYESDLLLALQYFDEESKDPFLDILSWQELIQSALFAVFHSSSITKSEKEIMEAQLLVADEPDVVRIRSIEHYLECVPQPNYLVMKRLSEIAESRRADHLVTALSRAMSIAIWYRNCDLERLWRVCLAKNQADLAWRIASVAKFRDILGTSIVQAWSVSGEARSIYPVPLISKNQIASCTEDFDSHLQRICLAIIGMEGRLREILPEIDSDLVEYKWKPSNMRDQHMIGNLSKLTWFAVPKKRLGKHAAVEVGPLPVTFAEFHPANDWADTLCWLSEFTAVTYLPGQVDALIRLADQITSNLQPRRGAKIENFPIKWLKSLTPNQRSAWHDLILNVRKLQTENIIMSLNIFLIRLSTLIHPNHSLALKTLSEMRAPLQIIRSLEKWILSDQLTNIREQLCRSSGVPIPKHLSGAGLKQDLTV